jgi:predicted secreted protein
MTDAEIAIERLTALVRDHGDSKPQAFIGDVSMLLTIAKGAVYPSMEPVTKTVEKKPLTDDLYEMAEELGQAADLEGSEVGEWWSALSALVPRVFDAASDEFREAFEKELRSQYLMFKEEYSIVETTKYMAVTSRKLRHCDE